jgi:replicative DNA helicase
LCGFLFAAKSLSRITFSSSPAMSVASAPRPRPRSDSTGAARPSDAGGAGGAARAGERIAPHNIDAEQGLLASCLLENGQDVLNDCLASKLRPEYFYRSAHQIIFEALCDLNKAGIPPDEILLSSKLKDAGQLEAIGGHAYLYELTNRIQTTVHARHWLQIIRDKFFLRQLIRTSQWTVEQAHSAGGQQDGPGGVSELLNSVESAFFQIQQDTISDSAEPLSKSIDTATALVTRMLNREGGLSGVPSGFTDLDKMTFGFQPSEMIVVAARPSMGKTSIALNIAETATMPSPREGARKPTGTLIYSLEMAAEQLAMRLLCSHAHVDMQRLKDGFCDRQRELIDSAKLLKQAPLWIDASANLNILEMRAKARRLHSRHKLGLVIIDYLQLVSPGGNYNSREQEVAEVSRGIKAMAKELNLPVVVLCQLNRESEKEKRLPRLSDLRESGSIEQDADVVLLLSKSRDSRDEVEQPDQLAVKRDLVIAKNRNGPIGEISLTFNKRLTRFENFTAHGA